MSANLERFTGLAGVYDAFRPSPPAALADVLTLLAGCERPRLVVDIGCGTGLSTRLWAERAESVAGIEPNADMRRQAIAATHAENITYQEGLSTRTSLPDASADIVTVSQALHWMEPEPTFAEVHRLLRPGGVFAAYDYDWPPTMGWEMETAYLHLIAQVEAREDRAQKPDFRTWAKSDHIARLRACGLFRYVKELTLHHREMGNAERLLGAALTSSSIGTEQLQGASDEELGLDRLPDEPRPWYWSYRVRVAGANICVAGRAGHTSRPAARNLGSASCCPGASRRVPTGEHDKHRNGCSHTCYCRCGNSGRTSDSCSNGCARTDSDSRVSAVRYLAGGCHGDSPQANTSSNCIPDGDSHGYIACHDRDTWPFGDGDDRVSDGVYAARDRDG